jgi:hypothetical protein
VEFVSDEELERIAIAEGPESMAAQTLVLLKKQRAKDPQLVAFRFANSFAVGLPGVENDEMLQMLEWHVCKPRKA